MGMQMHQTLMGFRRDDDSLRGRKFERELLRRVLRMTRPYRRQLVGFLLGGVALAAVSALPALVFRAILDDAVPKHDKTLVLVLSLGAVALAIASAALGLLQRWYSARIGEGLIYDMRVRLFDHIQRLPIAFFTRTQTG